VGAVISKSIAIPLKDIATGLFDPLEVKKALSETVLSILMPCISK
jgi:hypothetical protein